MANPNELFSTLHFNAYNEPKGRLVILKRDYENKSALVVGAKFSAAGEGRHGRDAQLCVCEPRTDRRRQDGSAADA